MTPTPTSVSIAMPTVTFIEPNGRRYEVEADLNRSLMQLAQDHGVPGILGDCGGACSCATCHGYIEAAWLDRLPAPSETEAFMLDAVSYRLPGSRLCCQIRMDPTLDGIVIHVPADQG